ncbi:uncharacterized protein LOC128390746 [Panonychus citri]|uniref:uncharacterized protein LOC128390746 n=1 Tax=Panonychus citri TaxID=50023 RepID=UPI00230747B7|nr:uncharacterized protein LOC128390746 [Panonychus citri]
MKKAIELIYFSSLITLFSMSYIDMKYLVSRSELDEVCSMSVRLLSSGWKEDQIEPIFFHKLLQFNRQSKPGKSLPLGYLPSDIRTRAGPNSQSGSFNLNVGNFINATVNLMECISIGKRRRKRGACLPLTDPCPVINFPDEVDFDDEKQINSLTQQIRLKKDFFHKCDPELLSAPLQINQS